MDAVILPRGLISLDPHSPNMASLPLLGPTPISVDGHPFDLPQGTCFACPSTERQHLRKWAPALDNPLRKRTLVLCFDGTGESFDADVSKLDPIISS
jgi:hypothetical protein